MPRRRSGDLEAPAGPDATLGAWLDAQGLSGPPAAGTIADVALVRDHLLSAARAGQAISYSDLLRRLGHRFTRPKMRALCRTLDAIDRDGEARGEPPLAVLVVRESDRLPGQGWWTGAVARGHGGAWTGPEAVAHVRAEQQRAFDHWRGGPTSPLQPSPERRVLCRQEDPTSMDVSKGNVVERVARVLAGQRLSANAQGFDSSASAKVDAEWHEHVEDALAVLRTLREPDAAMAAVGDVAVWERMIRAALPDDR